MSHADYIPQQRDVNPDDAVMLLIDHQSGLFQLVKDIPGA